MKNQITKLTKITCFTLIAAALIAAPAVSRAGDSTNAPAAQAPATKKPHPLPYRGKVAAVDANAMTFTIGTRTFDIASTTKITKDGKPAVFSDITVGEYVTGSYKKGGDGKLTASSVKIGAPKKKDAAAAPATPAESSK